MAAFSVRDAGPISWFLLLLGIGFLMVVFWRCVRLKSVSLDEDSLYVSNYLKEISILLSEISQVTENRWPKYLNVTIHLNSPSDFGDKIVFWSKSFPGRWNWSPDPIVDELEELVKSKKSPMGSLFNPQSSLLMKSASVERNMKYRYKFGVAWDENLRPWCIYCDVPLTQRMSKDSNNEYLMCMKDGKLYKFHDQDGNYITIEEAKKLVEIEDDSKSKD